MKTHKESPSSPVNTEDHDIDTLRFMLGVKEDIIDKKSLVIQSQKVRIALLEEKLKLQLVKQYQSKSEQQPDQLGMFNEAEDLQADESASEETSESKTGKKSSGQKGLNPDIPRVQECIELSDEEKAGAIDTFFVKVKEELDIVPARVQVVEILQEKAVFLNEDNERYVVAAVRPKPLLGKCIASINTLAYIIIAKYMDALPLYRLEKILARYGGSVTRTTLANWLIQLSEQLYPLINLLREHQWQGDLIQADETRLQVLKEPGRSVTSDKWMWLTRGGPPGQLSVLFEYDPSRSGQVPLRLLDGFNGYLQTDGYAGYNAIVRQNKLIHLGCWDHARRKFDEAIKGSSTDKKKAKIKGTPPSKTRVALSKINKLYVIERELKGKTTEEKYLVRQEKSIPLLNELKLWLEKNVSKVPKGGLSWTAMNYTLNQWDHLVRYCEQGDLPISNILAENAIRPLCIGRRNWLFSDTPKGARASALYYSLIETAKANGWEPYQYFKIILKELPEADTVEKLEALLPWNLKNENKKLVNTPD